MFPLLTWKITVTDANGEDEAREYILQMHAKIPKLAVMCMKKHCVYEDIQEIIKDINKVVSYSCLWTVDSYI